MKGQITLMLKKWMGRIKLLYVVEALGCREWREEFSPHNRALSFCVCCGGAGIQGAEGGIQPPQQGSVLSANDVLQQLEAQVETHL